MKVYRADVVIQAPIEAVWGVLTDFSAYAAWNPFTPVVRTGGRPGDAVELEVDLGWLGRQPQRMVLRENAPYRLAWSLRMWGSVLCAERTQTLQETPAGTLYETADAMQGPLEPVVRLLMRRTLERGFGQLTQALKRRCEELADASRHPVTTERGPE